LGYYSWFTVLLAATGVSGQAMPRALPASRDRAIAFSNAKPVLGLPLDGSRRQGLCSSDGLTYFDAAADATGTSRVLDLYGVSTSGEVRHLRRTVPIEFTNVFDRDFFPGDAALVTLIEAQERDGRDPDDRPYETQYYLSVFDHDGDQSKLLALDLPFKPLKIAQFGGGEFAVLGWEEANQLAKLAVLKEDGTLRRFIDLYERQTGSHSEAATLASLAGAAFVPFGGQILLTYPGTVKPIRILNAAGHDTPVSLEFPAGYRLHDVLNSGGPSTIVARVQEMAELDTAGKKEDAAPPRQRVFEFQWVTGQRIREFTFDKVPASAVTCAANNMLGAVFEQSIDSAANPGGEGPATQLVVGTVRR
jgi:hypothetical protein